MKATVTSILIGLLFGHAQAAEFKTYDVSNTIKLDSHTSVEIKSHCKQEQGIEAGPVCDHKLKQSPQGKTLNLQESRISNFFLTQEGGAAFLVGKEPGCCASPHTFHFYTKDLVGLGHIHDGGFGSRGNPEESGFDNYSGKQLLLSQEDLNKNSFAYNLVTVSENGVKIDNLQIQKQKDDCWFAIEKSEFSSKKISIHFSPQDRTNCSNYRALCNLKESKWICSLDKQKHIK